MRITVFSATLFAQAPIVGIIRGLSAEEVGRLLPVYLDAGLTTVEITMNTPGAAGMIAAAIAAYAGRLNIGAGTVRSMADLDAALEAGAQFIVTPSLNEAVIRSCVARQVPVFPGALTPTEIELAWSLGATMVKVYPASAFGPGYIRDVKAPMDEVKLLPTGGVDAGNIGAFFRAGADGVGMGGQLIDKSLIRADDMQGLSRHFSAVLNAWRNAVTDS
nr:bifunctional 4-hydroxy-2-oxoglutarate aldolase/2-dehydro-3-deoxy-phosphogluconate aldolase [uncultured Arsenicibacter sp.]